MNKHVIIILKWLNNPDSVTRKELDVHYDSINWIGDSDGDILHLSLELAIEAMFIEKIEVANGFIDEYFRLSGEDRSDYEKAIFMESHGLGEEDMKGGNLSDIS